MVVGWGLGTGDWGRNTGADRYFSLVSGRVSMSRSAAFQPDASDLTLTCTSVRLESLTYIAFA